MIFYSSTSEDANEGGRVVQTNYNYEQLKNDFKINKITMREANQDIHYYRNIYKYDNEEINFNDIKKSENFFRIRSDAQLVVTKYLLVQL